MSISNPGNQDQTKIQTNIHPTTPGNSPQANGDYSTWEDRYADLKDLYEPDDDPFYDYYDDFPDLEAPILGPKGKKVMAAIGGIVALAVLYNVVTSDDDPKDKSHKTEQTAGNDAAEKKLPDVSAAEELIEPFYDALGVSRKIDGGKFSDLDREVLASDKLDPEAKVILQKMIDIRTAERLTETAEYAVDIDQIELDKISDPTIRAEAEMAFNAKRAEKIASSEYSLDPVQDRLYLESLPEPIKSAALNIFDNNMASRATDRAQYDELGANSLIENITNQDIREQAIKAVSEITKTPRASLEMKWQSEFEHNMQDAGNALQNLAPDYWRMKIDTQDELIKLISQRVKAHNNMTASDFDKLPELENPDEIINLNDIIAPQDATIINDEGYETSLGMYAEIISVDGELVMDFKDDNYMSKKTKQQLKDIFEHNRPVLEAAYANGNVLRVRWLLGGESPSYNPQTHEIDMIFEGTATKKEMSAILDHELTHALNRDIFSEDGASVEEVTDIMRTCDALKTIAFDQFEQGLNHVLPTDLEQLAISADPKLKPVIDQLVEAFKAYDLNRFIKIDEDPEPKFDAVLNNCLDSGELLDLINEIATTNKILITEEDKDKLNADVNFQKLAKEWDKVKDSYSIYEKLNESSYIEPDSFSTDYYGHSEDNVNEAIASVSDVLLNYDKQLAEMIRSMSPEEREVSIKMVRLTVDLITSRYPTLVGLYSSHEANVLEAVNVK